MIHAPSPLSPNPAMLATALAVATLITGSDKIDFPKVVWHAPDAYGAPIVGDSGIYSGGLGLFLLDHKTGLALTVAEKGERSESEPMPIVGPPSLEGATVIARRGKGGVVAYDLTLENKLWEWEGSSSGYVHAGTLVDGVYYFTLDSKVIALDIKTGDEKWKRALSGALNMTPAVGAGMVFAGSDRGTLYALDAETGEHAWTKEGLGSLGWTDPVAADGVVYIGDRGLSGQGQRLAFNAQVTEASTPRKGALHAFDAKTGEHKWGRVFGATGFSTPFVDKKTILAGFGKYVARFDRKTGEIDEGNMIRTGTNPFGSPTVVGKRIYFGNLDGHLYAHRMKGGALEWAFSVPDAQVSDFVHTGSAIYVSTTKGLFALGSGRKGKGGSTLVWQG